MDFTIPDVNIEELKTEEAEISKQIVDPKLNLDYQKAREISARHKFLVKIIEIWETLDQKTKEYKENQKLSNDPEFTSIATIENEKLKIEIQNLLQELENLTLPPLDHDESNAIFEIRAGTGGVEASLFASEIHRMYLRFINSIGFQVEQLTTSYQEEGGIKEVSFLVKGPGAYGKLRFESGVHRVQRIPVTESSGRIHTSAISVVVMPEIAPTEVQINDSDLKIEVFRSSGPGGQSVNTTDSAVRITHLPSGISISCQDGKSQHKNKEKAMSILTSKLYEMQIEQEAKEANQLRSSAIQTGDRSAKIRTYNFQQGRVTDHRIKKSWFSLPQIIEGEIGEIVDTVNLELRKQLQQQN